MRSNSRNFVLEEMSKDLDLPMSCKHHGDECDFSGNLASVIEHEEDCPFRPVECAVIWCEEQIRFTLIMVYKSHLIRATLDALDFLKIFQEP